MRLRFFILSVFLILFQVCAYTQIRGGFNTRIPQFDRGVYYVDPLVFYDIDSLKPRLDVFVEIPKGNLLFVKKAGIYTNSMEITLILKDSKDAQVFKQKYTETISYKDAEFKEELKKSIFYLHNYYLNTGSYKLETTLNDITAGKEHRKINEITVKEFANNPVTFSDIMLLSEYSTTNDGSREITPLISNNIFGLPRIHIFFEIYNNTTGSVNKVYSYKITDHNNDVIKEGVLSYYLSDRKSNMFEKIAIGNPFSEMLEPEDPDIKEIRKKDFGVCKITISDKSTGETVSEKTIYFIPGRMPFKKPPDM